MANWSPLRERLRTVDDEITFPWDELDSLVGGLPPSASKHAAFWGGDRSAWTGFTARRVGVGQSVTFVRRGQGARNARGGNEEPPPRTSATADLILVGCVKSKLAHPAAARDLYTSPLFRKARAYAERSGAPWFVLSAEHGLVRPTTELEPYDLRLGSTSAAYRREWADRVLRALSEEVGVLDGLVVEIHAGAPYVDAIEAPLTAAGASVIAPLKGLTMGRRLAWYRGPSRSSRPGPRIPPST